MKVALESMHHLEEVINAEDIREVYCGNPATSEDLITVKMKDGRALYCDCLNFDYVEGDYENGYR